MKALMILAMHRSGTSLVASWLQKSGLRMALDRQMGAGVANVLGHYEDLDFVDLHRRSIRRQVRRSRGWKVSSARPLRFNAREAAAAEQLIAAREQVGAPWGWKDPRTILFAEEWKSRLPDLQALVIWRDGARVVDSLVARGKKSAYRDDAIGYLESCVLNRAHLALTLEYVRRHPHDVFGCAAEDLVLGDGDALRGAIESRCDIQLEPVSIQQIFDARLLDQRRSSMRSRLLNRLLGGHELERRLRKLTPTVR